MAENTDNHFSKIFWFIVGLTGFGGFLTIYLMIRFKGDVAERFADQAMIFWLTSAVGGGIGYLIGSSMNKPTGKINQAAGTTTADISATITTEAPDEDKEDKSKTKT